MIFSYYLEKKWAGIGNIQALVKFFLPGGLNKTKHVLSQDSWCLDLGLYLRHGEHKAGCITGLSWTRTQG
jgi:hypothetical protein